MADVWGHVADIAARDGGVTVSWRGDVVTSGVAVSVSTLAYYTGWAPGGESLRFWAEKGSASTYLGVWHDKAEDQWEVSAVAVYNTRDEALRVARGHAQRYVYDLGTDDLVEVTYA